MLRKRSRYIQDIRGFFLGEGYLEVDTPILSDSIIPESGIELFKTNLQSFGAAELQELYLLPSPELWMKRLIADGAGDIFQFSRCFRNREEISRLHQPEFLMLEWYAMDCDYLDSIDITEELLDALAPADAPYLKPPFRRMTVHRAFMEYAGIDLEKCQDLDRLQEEAERKGLSPGTNYSWADLFNAIFITWVEPKLPKEKPLILIDYPSQVSCLASKKAGSPWRERWELYLKGIETANCYTEETDPGEAEKYFAEENLGLAAAGRAEETDLSFPSMYHKPHPRCSGTAVGIDRLIMALTGVGSIAEVMPFAMRGTPEA
jgi:elongation factor P--(R)-beta-lysine ligase